MADDIEDQDFKYLEGLIKKMDEKLTRAIQEVREEQARTSGSMDEIKKMIQGLISSRHEVNVPSHPAAVNRNDGILGSGDSSMVHASNEFSMRANSYAKIEFPRFDGSCITEWLYKADQFFEIDHTNEWNKEKIASLHLDGKALHWYKAFLETKEKDKAISWKEFVTAATDRFGELLILNPVSELKNLKQKESLQQHLEEFNYAKLEPMVVLKGGIYTIYQEQETLKFMQPSLMKSVDAPQFFEEILQWEFVPWNAKIGTEFEKQLNDVTYSSDGNFSSNDQQQWAVIVATYLKSVTKLINLEILSWKVYDGGGFQGLKGSLEDTHDHIGHAMESFPQRHARVNGHVEKAIKVLEEETLNSNLPMKLEDAQQMGLGMKSKLDSFRGATLAITEVQQFTNDVHTQELLYLNKLLKEEEEFDPYLRSSLIDMYAEMGAIEATWALFDELLEKSVNSWNVLIVSYIKCCMFEETIFAFLRMEKSEVELNEATLVTTLSTCVSLGDLEMGRKVHGFMENREIKGSIPLNNALLGMYTKCGCIQESLEIFRTIVRKDTTTWTSVIFELARNG